MSAHMPGDRSFHVIEVQPEQLERLEASLATPRRRWSAEAKARLVAEAMAPEANVSATARRNGMSPAQLFGWQRQALKHMNALQSESLPAAPASTLCRIEIIIDGITVRAGADIGEEALRRVIRAVRSA